MEEVMRLSEAVHEIIRLGNTSRAYWDRELRRHHPHYPKILPAEESVLPPPEDAEIRAILKSLPEEQLYALFLLTYVGRGTYGADHLPASYQAMKETFPNRDLATGQMMENTAIAEDLQDAAEELSKHHIDLDSLEYMSTAGAS
jgi:hypothetical protein